eukprot:ctg_2260.g739
MGVERRGGAAGGERRRAEFGWGNSAGEEILKGGGAMGGGEGRHDGETRAEWGRNGGGVRRGRTSERWIQEGRRSGDRAIGARVARNGTGDCGGPMENFTSATRKIHSVSPVERGTDSARQESGFQCGGGGTFRVDASVRPVRRAWLLICGNKRGKRRGVGLRFENEAHHAGAKLRHRRSPPPAAAGGRRRRWRPFECGSGGIGCICPVETTHASVLAGAQSVGAGGTEKSRGGGRRGSCRGSGAGGENRGVERGWGGLRREGGRLEV